MSALSDARGSRPNLQLTCTTHNHVEGSTQNGDCSVVITPHNLAGHFQDLYDLLRRGEALAVERLRLLPLLPDDWELTGEGSVRVAIDQVNKELVGCVDTALLMARVATNIDNPHISDVHVLAKRLRQARRDINETHNLLSGLQHAQTLTNPLLTAAASAQQPTKLAGGQAAGSVPDVPRVADHMVNATLRLLPVEHRGRYKDEFHAELFALAQANATRSMLALYALQQLSRVLQLRSSLRFPNRPRFYRLRCIARWLLASEWRTWCLLGPFMAAAVINVTLSQGWGSAFFCIPGAVGFHYGVKWLRRRLGVDV